MFPTALNPIPIPIPYFRSTMFPISEDLLSLFPKPDALNRNAPKQVYAEMAKLTPLPSVFHGDFIAANQV